ncbi:hypothetical protein [[Clostridium] hylemonae]|uniref:Uncharacterized protein n=1 Tax=[Clostridium] hylemonae DSM 15053 TaxID=553973 RepID=C0C3D4_9FIRM|nr:hypothetical protein [[Clostridium] hylemonae]EEG73310.1 hypothetical protein CLOHYLEM_06595 [[Clostridium] hylemonae DSM 15053]QEK17391.1 hypothetical protein LAJLEIBI_01401 [[Clostridium] hylemonae DSM 15053]BDF04398.1 hypothetical protein CE91St63_14600 [[Clostridium] hylemonae]
MAVYGLGKAAGGGGAVSTLAVRKGRRHGSNRHRQNSTGNLDDFLCQLSHKLHL